MQSTGGGASLWKLARTATLAHSFTNRLTHSVAAAAEALKRTTAARPSREGIDFENTQAIEQRRRLRQAPALLEVFDMWWTTAQRSSSAGSSSFELGKQGYIAMSRKIQKSMLSDYEEAEAMRVAEEDWLSDARGASSLGREAFYDSLFELADLWTNSVEAEDYADFLLGLFGCITEGSSNLDITHGTDFVWKSDEAISYSGYVMPDSADDVEQDGRLSGEVLPSSNECTQEAQRMRRRTREASRRSTELQQPTGEGTNRDEPHATPLQYQVCSDDATDLKGTTAKVRRASAGSGAKARGSNGPGGAAPLGSHSRRSNANTFAEAITFQEPPVCALGLLDEEELVPDGKQGRPLEPSCRRRLCGLPSAPRAQGKPLTDSLTDTLRDTLKESLSLPPVPTVAQRQIVSGNVPSNERSSEIPSSLPPLVPPLPSSRHLGYLMPTVRSIVDVTGKIHRSMAHDATSGSRGHYDADAPGRPSHRTQLAAKEGIKHKGMRSSVSLPALPRLPPGRVVHGHASHQIRQHVQ